MGRAIHRAHMPTQKEDQMPVRGPKVKIARALGLAITPKAGRIMEKRPFGPGQHGMARKRNASVYKTQLLEKQRLKHTYNVSEAQLHAAYTKATRAHGSTGEKMLQILETRIDAVVLRLGFASSPYAARQYVSHGHFEINGKRCWTASHAVKPGDVVSVREKSKNHPQIIEASSKAGDPPEYLQVDRDNLRGTLLSLPLRTQMPLALDEQLVIEFYSR